MSDEQDDSSIEDKEYEYELMMETGERLQDLAMALCHFNDELAKQSLALALGTLIAHFPEEPCLHQLTDLMTVQMEATQKRLSQTKNESN